MRYFVGDRTYQGIVIIVLCLIGFAFIISGVNP